MRTINVTGFYCVVEMVDMCTDVECMLRSASAENECIDTASGTLERDTAGAITKCRMSYRCSAVVTLHQHQQPNARISVSATLH